LNSASGEHPKVVTVSSFTMTPVNSLEVPNMRVLQYFYITAFMMYFILSGFNVLLSWPPISNVLDKSSMKLLTVMKCRPDFILKLVAGQHFDCRKRIEINLSFQWSRVDHSQTVSLSRNSLCDNTVSSPDVDFQDQ
jgi:hypothetical protein